MQTFEQYLKDIHAINYMGTDDDMPEKFETWLANQDIDTLMSYADDYAKDCVRLDRERINKGIKGLMKFTQKDTGSFKYDWAFEECIEVVNTK